MASANRLDKVELIRTPQELTRRSFYRVTVDSTSNGDEAVFAVSGVPKIGTAHPDNSAYLCTQVSAVRMDESRLNFEVSADYAIRPKGKRPTDASTTPLTEPPSWNFKTMSRTLYFTSDFQGNPYVNINFDPIKPSGIEDTGLVLHYSRNESAPDLSFANTVNNDSFMTFPPWSCWIKSMECDPIYQATGLNYYRVAYEIHFRYPRQWRNVFTGNFESFGGFVTLRQNEGFLDSSRTRIVDANGNPKVEVSLLDQNGDESGTQFYIPFYDYKDKTFGSLNPPIVLN